MGLNARRYDAVIFDMDGLLLDTERVALTSFAETCEQFAVSDRIDVFYHCIGTNRERGLAVIREGLGARVDPDRFWAEWGSRYREANARQPIALKPGAAALLQHLGWRQTPLGVATSTPTSEAVEKLESAGIAHHFAAVVGGDQVAHSKPHPDIYLRAAAVLEARPTACLALEDSENGVRAAISAGMTVIQVPDLVAPSSELRALGHLILDSLEHVEREALASRPV